MRLQDARLFRVSQGVGFRVQSVVGLRFSLLGDHRGSIQRCLGIIIRDQKSSIEGLGGCPGKDCEASSLHVYYTGRQVLLRVLGLKDLVGALT